MRKFLQNNNFKHSENRFGINLVRKHHHQKIDNSIGKLLKSHLKDKKHKKERRFPNLSASNIQVKSN